jgi:hypothetical protein
MSPQAACVPPMLIDQFLPLARPFISSATGRCGDWREAEIVDGLRGGRMLLWFAIEHGRVLAAAVTQLIASPATGRVCRIVLCGGRDVRRWAHLKDAIEVYARDESCTRVRMSGRPGWARMFRDYRQPYVTLEKML